METKGFGVGIGKAGDSRIYDFSVLKKSFKIQEITEDEVVIPQDKLPGVIDQGSYQSCVACSLAAVLEFFDGLESAEPGKQFSHPYIYGKHRAKDSTSTGMLVETALKSMLKCGSVPLSVYPRPIEMPEAKKMVQDDAELEKIAEHSRIGGYCKIRWGNDQEAVENIYLAIKNTGAPVIATSYHAFGGHHCIVIYGANVKTKEVYVQNSWGETWGNKGRAKMGVGNFESVWMVMDEMVALPFKDVPEDAWYYKAIANMYRAGYLNGKSEDTFDPDGYVKRSELAQAMNNMLKRLDEIDDARAKCIEVWIKDIEDRI